jgi:preprotein translocase subunit SecG
MQLILLVLHVLVCALLVLVVMVQSSKGGGLGNMFGGGSADALFSAPSGSSFIKKLTGWLAAIFLFTSISLTYLSAHRGLRTVTQNQFPMPPPAPAAPRTP